MECTKIFAILRIAYPGFYKATSAKGYSGTVVLWATMFPDDPLDLVSAAVPKDVLALMDGRKQSILLEQETLTVRKQGA